MYLHAERHVANAGGSKCKERGITHRWSGGEAGAEGRRAAQAERGSLGRLLARARGQRPHRRLVYRIVRVSAQDL